MQLKPISVLIIRHPRERLSKCSLTPLHGRPELTFRKAQVGMKIDVTGYTLLSVGASTLSPEDAGRPLLLLDSTWRLLPQLNGCLTGEPILRSLPEGVATAYPRVSKVSEDPLGGLASVEALYWARRLLGDDDPSLLDGYYWKEAFLRNISTWEARLLDK
jgi:pre-rRNA-processing protein TSR3